MIFNPIFIILFLGVALAIIIGWNIRLEMKIKKLLIGKSAKSLEDSIVAAGENLKELNIFQKEVIAHFLNVEKRLKRSIQSVETVRFNPFKGNGDGGNQSFSTAFISENGDGVVVSSLYSRDRVSIFSKPVTTFESKFELTEEENEVIGNSKALLK